MISFNLHHCNVLCVQTLPFTLCTKKPTNQWPYWLLCDVFVWWVSAYSLNSLDLLEIVYLRKNRNLFFIILGLGSSRLRRYQQLLSCVVLFCKIHVTFFAILTHDRKVSHLLLNNMHLSHILMTKLSPKGVYVYVFCVYVSLCICAMCLHVCLWVCEWGIFHMRRRGPVYRICSFLLNVIFQIFHLLISILPSVFLYCVLLSNEAYSYPQNFASVQASLQNLFYIITHLLHI